MADNGSRARGDDGSRLGWRITDGSNHHSLPKSKGPEPRGYTSNYPTLVPLNRLHRLLHRRWYNPSSRERMLRAGASSGQHFQFAHQWFGLLIFLGVFAQAGLGWYHHKRYEQDKPTSRRWWTHAHLWLGRILLFFALINIGLGIQLFGDGAAAQAIWYLLTIAAVGIYAFFYWRGHIRRRKRVNDSFDPSPFEDPAPEDNAGERPYTTYKPVSVGVMNDNDLGTYRTGQSADSQEYYDPAETGYGAPRTDIPPTIKDVNRPGTAVRPSTSAMRPAPSAARPMTGLNRPPTSAMGPMGARQYDTTPATIPGPYSPTEPLSMNAQPRPQQDPFLDPLAEDYYPDPAQDHYRPRTGRSAAPYPVSTVSHETIPSGRAPAYGPSTFYV